MLALRWPRSSTCRRRRVHLRCGGSACPDLGRSPAVGFGVRDDQQSRDAVEPLLALAAWLRSASVQRLDCYSEGLRRGRRVDHDESHRPFDRQAGVRFSAEHTRVGRIPALLGHPSRRRRRPASPTRCHLSLFGPLAPLRRADRLRAELDTWLVTYNTRRANYGDFMRSRTSRQCSTSTCRERAA